MAPARACPARRHWGWGRGEAGGAGTYDRISVLFGTVRATGEQRSRRGGQGEQGDDLAFHDGRELVVKLPADPRLRPEAGRGKASASQATTTGTRRTKKSRRAIFRGGPGDAGEPESACEQRDDDESEYPAQHGSSAGQGWVWWRIRRPGGPVNRAGRGSGGAFARRRIAAPGRKSRHSADQSASP